MLSFSFIQINLLQRTAIVDSFLTPSYMLILQQVTSVGINTEWGLLMASISEDNGEETPLQVRYPNIFVYVIQLIKSYYVNPMTC